MCVCVGGGGVAWESLVPGVGSAPVRVPVRVRVPACARAPVPCGRVGVRSHGRHGALRAALPQYVRMLCACWHRILYASRPAPLAPPPARPGDPPPALIIGTYFIGLRPKHPPSPPL